jgi:aspartyl-tRNA synthetase
LIGFPTRSHRCGEIARSDIGKPVLLHGWVHRIRDLGGVLFVQVRDVSGIAQVVFDASSAPDLARQAAALKPEYVVRVRGDVRERPEGTATSQLSTGEVEVVAGELAVLNPCVSLPFAIAEEGPVSDHLRLKYRYLDLRKPDHQRRLVFRSRFISHCRRYMESQGFLEIETPILTRSTPEGARDFLVPSRLSPGNFFALPQSPQLFKQILMVAGFDRYFQVCRCFRDEDLRADRQPEFTQLDVEASFLPPDGLFEIVEGLFTAAGEAFGFPVSRPFPRLTWAEAMARYGSDKPDTRFGLELVDLTDLAAGCGFRVFAEAVAAGGQVKALAVPRAGEFSRSEIDELVEQSKTWGARGMAWAKVGEGGQVASPIKKFLSDELFARIVERSRAGAGDLMLFVADRAPVVAATLSAVRLAMGRRQGLIDPDRKAFLWVTEFPWLEWDDTEKRFNAMHHPFTKPVLADLETYKDDPGRIRAQAYDLVLNGNEIGGGSVRIHRTDLQEQMFAHLGIQPDEARAKFGFLLDALAFGAPPHAGLALGLDRITALLSGEGSLREVIAFPKTQKGQCLMTEAPSPVSAAQLAELELALAPRRE